MHGNNCQKKALHKKVEHRKILTILIFAKRREEMRIMLEANDFFNELDAKYGQWKNRKLFYL
uniref:Uncharacterized protein n=1 Tax=Romanomermis culicivorax TaxID=13658 RepID=A0A915I1A2_ROMCU